MSTARRFKPHWDDAAFIMRTDPERIRKPRPVAEVIMLPKSNRLDAERAVRAWEAIGHFEITEARIRAHWAELKKWQRG